ncbi:TPA: hypothetical protein JHJ70_005616 [Serratia marcescens]|nr:hypothetical protein [Serratia marcescens]HAV2134404.1 hypothetical protein [Serratia marcescens]HAV2139604.1 hypothetical protein [Serratia marcescens]
MSNTGETLINAIVSNNSLMAINNCPGVTAQMSRAVYGKTQDDSGAGTTIENNRDMQKNINIALGFSGANSETAVWHFMIGPPVHHFVVIPWYQHTAPHGRVYTVFMAYENRYSVGGYVQHTPPAPSAVKGYRTVWSVTDLGQMFSDLLTSATAWQTYFGAVGAAQANKITYWKYKVTSLDSAVANVNKYR